MDMKEIIMGNSPSQINNSNSNNTNTTDNSSVPYILALITNIPLTIWTQAYAC